jgi:hypothetical protein
MQVRRDRITITNETQEWFKQLAKHQTKLAVRETEEAAQKKMEEQIKELEHKLEIQERDHKLEILKRDTQEAEAKFTRTPPFDIDPPDNLKSLGIKPNQGRILCHIKENDPKYLKWRELGSKLEFSEENLEIEASERSENPAQYTSETPRYNPYFEDNCIGKMINQ